MILCIALIWCISVMIAASLPFLHVEKVKDEIADETCPPCELLFRRLERPGKEGKMIQDVKVQLRGEPMSGTGMPRDWATGALGHICDYLKRLFGEERELG